MYRKTEARNNKRDVEHPHPYRLHVGELGGVEAPKPAAPS